VSRPEWPIAFFDEDYLPIMKSLFTEEQTSLEVEFIASALARPRGAAILDLACGTGRHALGMARRGYEMTGLDFNADYLAVAAREAAGQGLSVRWMAGDMRALQFDREFDGVYCYFTSFGYYTDAENEDVLRRMVQALRPGGRLLLDMANRDWALAHAQPRTWTQRDDGSLLMEEATLDLRTSRVRSRLIHMQSESGARVIKSYELRLYTCAELTALMARRGLQVVEVWGGPDRGTYSTESRRLVMLAERTGSGERSE
jgi:2-polyprenyl-3-methyl-5-hydroxy-6-metoxy-1,4-benzoquinol methylase